MDDEEKIENESTFVRFYHNHKILVWLLIIIIAFIVIMKLIPNNSTNSSNKEEEKIELVLRQTSTSVVVGQTITLDASVNVTNAEINWSSSDASIAMVKKGSVTGIKEGKVTITATYTDSKNNTYSKSCDVTVVNNTIEVESVTIYDGDLYMPSDGKYQLYLIIVPNNATINSIEYYSNNSKVVTVSSDGIIRGVNEGETTVTAIVNGKFRKTINVYVDDNYPNSEMLISPTSVEFTSSTKEIKVGEIFNLDYQVKPSNAMAVKFRWSSSNESVVSVDQTGQIKAISAGEAVITISSANGIKDTITIVVKKNEYDVESIVVPNDIIYIERGNTTVITPTINPSTATNKLITYTSNDISVVNVVPIDSTKSAKLYANNVGTTTITIKAGNVTKKIEVKVIDESTHEEEAGFPNTIKVRSNKENLAKSYNDALNMHVSGDTTVTVTMEIGVAYIKYCINEYGSTLCKPNIQMSTNGTIEIPNGGMYVLRIVKYDYTDNEIKSASDNYIDGVLHYYINTNSTVSNTYTTQGVYSDISSARSNPGLVGNKVSINVSDSTRYLKVCSMLDSTCMPNNRVNSIYTITLNKPGTWHIYVYEYDKTTNELIGTKVYYAYIEENYQNEEFTISNLNILNNAMGKYLSVNVSSSDNFYNTRFCYKVANSGADQSCNLDLNSSVVLLHDGGNNIHAKEENKTYYATFTSVNNKIIDFYIDKINDFYNNNITNKDIIFEFAVMTSRGYSKPIRIRIKMIQKSGNDSYWSAAFIK